MGAMKSAVFPLMSSMLIGQPGGISYFVCTMVLYRKAQVEFCVSKSVVNLLS